MAWCLDTGTLFFPFASIMVKHMLTNKLTNSHIPYSTVLLESDIRSAAGQEIPYLV